MKKGLFYLALFGLTLGLSWAESERVRITGLNIRGDAQRKITYISGNARIVQNKTVITARSATIDMDRKKAILEGGVMLGEAEFAIAAARLEYDMRQKVGIFQKEVRLDYKPIKNPAGKFDSEPFRLFCQELYLETNHKNFSAMRQIRFEHTSFTGSADRFEYEDKRQEVHLLGKARLNRPPQNKAGQNQEPFQLQSEQIILMTKTKNFSTSGSAVLEQNEFRGTAERIVYHDATQEIQFQEQVSFDRLGKAGASAQTSKEPFQLTCDQLNLASNTKNFTAMGAARLVQSDFVGTSAQMTYLDNRQELTLSEKVHLSRVVKAGSKSKNKEPFELESATLVLSVNNKNFIAFGEASLKHPDFQGTADQIEYDDERQLLRMVGHASLKRPEGEIIQGEQVTINLDDKSFIVNNKVNLSFDVKEEETKK
jgi:lipopolysaccharide export system protein LptA